MLFLVDFFSCSRSWQTRGWIQFQVFGDLTSFLLNAQVFYFTYLQGLAVSFSDSHSDEIRTGENIKYNPIPATILIPVFSNGVLILFSGQGEGGKGEKNPSAVSHRTWVCHLFQGQLT